MAASRRCPAVIITCEHGGNRVPPRYATLFAPHRALLHTHRGWDPGALDMGRAFAKALGAPFIASTTTRLLVELNRSLHNRSLFSAITRQLPEREKQHILDHWYYPHRQRVIDAVQSAISRGSLALHIAVHSFTPVLDGRKRSTDIGLLFDPSRPSERRFCTAWQRALRAARSDLTIHRNQPYRGVSDGLGTGLRKCWPASQYAAVELEVNQRLATGDRRTQRELSQALIDTCRVAINAMS